MIIAELPLHGAYQIDQEIHKDDRGFFARLFCQQELSAYGLDVNIVQVNNSQSVEKGTLRGLHFQRPPKTENKIVRCLRGAIWDVIVDLRKDSPTVGQWTALELSESNRRMMYVPEGFAHGFLSLKDDSELMYFVTEFYAPDQEGTVRWDDPVIGIEWPAEPVVISDKDANASTFYHNLEFYNSSENIQCR